MLRIAKRVGARKPEASRRSSFYESFGVLNLRLCLCLCLCMCICVCFYVCVFVYVCLYVLESRLIQLVYNVPRAGLLLHLGILFSVFFLIILSIFHQKYLKMFPIKTAGFFIFYVSHCFIQTMHSKLKRKSVK